MKFGSIQLLRAFAAILIVYAHSIDLSRWLGKSAQEDFYYLGKVGYIGVDLIFVISGFIITYIAGNYNGSRAAFKFLQHRFLRINPLYYIASILFLGAEYLQIWATHSTNGFLLRFNLIPGFVDTLWVVPTAEKLSKFKPYLQTGWTLAFVWLFSMLFFLSILIKVQRKALLLSILIVILVTVGYLVKPNDLRFSFITNGMLLEFLLGVLLYKLYSVVKKVPVILPVTFLLIGVAWYIALVFYNYGSLWSMSFILNGSLSLHRCLLWGLPGGCITLGCVWLEKDGLLVHLWNNRICRLLGNASYSILLIHSTVFTLLPVLYTKLNTLFIPDIGIGVQVVVAVIVGVAFYWYVEAPLLNWLRRSKGFPLFKAFSATPKPGSA